MSTAGLYGASRRRWVTTTVRDRAAKPAPDLIERNFTVTAPNRLWVADISYIPTWAGFLYLAVVLDACSRKIVGWAVETHLYAKVRTPIRRRMFVSLRSTLDPYRNLACYTGQALASLEHLKEIPQSMMRQLDELLRAS